MKLVSPKPANYQTILSINKKMTPSDRVEIRDYRLDLILVKLIYKSFIITEYIIMMTQPFLQDIQINRILRDHCIILNSIKLYHLLLDFPFYLSPWLPFFFNRI